MRENFCVCRSVVGLQSPKLQTDVRSIPGAISILCERWQRGLMRLIVDQEFTSSNLVRPPFLVPWCNGSTSDFLSEDEGSTPSGTNFWKLSLTGKAPVLKTGGR